MSFKLGDTVQLKSGGTVMTVEGNGLSPGFVWCIWNLGGVMNGHQYHIDTLKPADAKAIQLATVEGVIPAAKTTPPPRDERP